MARRNIDFKVNCKSPQTQELVQGAFNELSSIVQIEDEQVLKAMPIIRKNKEVLFKMVTIIATEGFNPISIGKLTAISLKIKK